MHCTFQLLRILKSNLQKMQHFLSYGDGESAVQITYQNDRILFLLEHVKDTNAKSDVARIQELADICICLQEECDKKLESITYEYKRELNTHLIKRQIIEHLKKNGEQKR